MMRPSVSGTTYSTIAQLLLSNGAGGNSNTLLDFNLQNGATTEGADNTTRILRLNSSGSATLSGNLIVTGSSNTIPGYATTADATYTAGSGISIASKVISATPYTAGTGIQVASNVISTNLSAGAGISIVGNVITNTSGGGGGGSTFSTVISTTNSTASTTTSTGALQIPNGGAGIGGNLNLGGSLNAGNTVGTTIASGSGGYALNANSGSAILYYISSSGTFVSNSNAGDYCLRTYNPSGRPALRLGNTTNGNQPSSLDILSSGNVAINPTTASTSPTNGALVIAGGAGVVGNANIGGNVTIAGNQDTTGYLSANGVLVSNNSTAATSLSTGAFRVPNGGGSLGGALHVGGPIKTYSTTASTSTTSGAF